MLKNYFTEEEYQRIKAEDELIYKSIEIVSKVFDNKVDKGGFPYVIHLMRVYSGASGYVEKVCALLHDIIEDTDVTYDDLRDVGYDEEIIEILSILTKVKGEDYRDYIDRIIDSGNIHAMNLKLADLRHNMDSGRIKNPTPNDYERITKRYEPAYEKISNRLNEINERRK